MPVRLLTTEFRPLATVAMYLASNLSSKYVVGTGSEAPKYICGRMSRKGNAPKRKNAETWYQQLQ